MKMMIKSSVRSNLPEDYLGPYYLFTFSSAPDIINSEGQHVHLPDIRKELDVKLPDWFDPNKSYSGDREHLFELNRVYADFLASRGFDTKSKVEALVYLNKSGIDVAPIIEEGFQGSIKDLKQIGKDKRTEEDEKFKEKIFEEFGEYWDESESSFIMGPEDDVGELLSQIVRMYDSPHYNKKYIAPKKIYKIKVLW